MKRISSKSWYITGVVIVVLLIMAGLGAIWYGAQATQQAKQEQQEQQERGDIIKKTDVDDYDELSGDDLNKRSKAIFGKSIDDLAASDIQTITKKGDTKASAYEAGRLLAAAGKTDASIKAFEVVVSQTPQVDQAAYHGYLQALDGAGRHSEGTALLRRELEALKKETPRDEIAISRLESVITERENYYK